MLFAHQGGWDEILFALSPLVVVGGLLGLANRRAKALQAARLAATGDDGAAPASPAAGDGPAAPDEPAAD